MEFPRRPGQVTARVPGEELGSAVDRFLPPVRWLVTVRPIRRFGTIDRVSWLLDGLTDVSAVKLRHLDHGVATFDLFYRGQVAVDILIRNALSSLGASVPHVAPNRVEIELDPEGPTSTDSFGFRRSPGPTV